MLLNPRKIINKYITINAALTRRASSNPKNFEAHLFPLVFQAGAIWRDWGWADGILWKLEESIGCFWWYYSDGNIFVCDLLCDSGDTCSVQHLTNRTRNGLLQRTRKSTESLQMLQNYQHNNLHFSLSYLAHWHNLFRCLKDNSMGK